MFFIHGFPCEGPFGWSVVCMFSLPFHGLYVCLPLPDCEVGSSPILGLCKFLGDSTVQMGSLMFPTLLVVVAVVVLTFWGLL